VRREKCRSPELDGGREKGSRQFAHRDTILPVLVVSANRGNPPGVRSVMSSERHSGIQLGKPNDLRNGANCGRCESHDVSKLSRWPDVKASGDRGPMQPPTFCPLRYKRSLMKQQLRTKVLIGVLIAVLQTAGPVVARDKAGVFTETYAEVGTTPEYPFQFPPCQGLVLNGVRYGYLMDNEFSGDCRVFVLPIDANPASGQVIDANAAGELRLTFDQPTRLLGFDLVLSTQEAQRVTVVVVRANGNVKKSTFVAAPVAAGRPSTGRFDYQGAAVSEILVTVEDGTDLRFAIDNVTYQQ
jgi:hypothetical protein